MTLLITIIILLFIMIGVPLFAAIGLASILLFLNGGIDPTIVLIEMNRLASAPTLLAIPLFTLAGYILAKSKAPERLFKFANTLLGWLPGGIAIVSLVTCALFTCLTGASGITIIAIGGLIYPILKKQNYSEKFSLGLITSSGSLGLLFPPSLPLILYGMVASVSVEKLFLAGIIPGILLIFVLSLYSIYKEPPQKKNKERFTFYKLFKSGKDAVWEIIIPIIVITSIYSGKASVVESAAITAFYVMVVEFLIKKDITIRKDLIPIMGESVQLIGGILIILCSSMGFTAYLIDEQIPQNALVWIQSIITSKYTFLIVLNIFLLITGTLLDIFSAIIIIVPFIVPIAMSYGINPIHLGIIFLTNLEIGYLTPPIGMNLFISSFRFKKSITYLYKSSIPFLIILLITLIIITYIPGLSLFLLKNF